MSRRIGDYAMIGDCRCAALIGLDGSLDWLCWPRFDSESLFGAILDDERGGRFSVRVPDAVTVDRQYLGDTAVLETTFYTPTGVGRLTDLMPVDSEQNKRERLSPQRQVLRRIECVDGEVDVELLCAPRPNYGATTPHLDDRGHLGIYFEHRDTVAVLLTDIPPLVDQEAVVVRGKAHLGRGERRVASLVFSSGEPTVLTPIGAESERQIERTLAWWSQWAARCTYEGPYRDAVVRSAITLKLLAYAPSGAVVAAPTTSLPERIGGVRNWDYRFCWLRDASMTLQALFDLGYPAEAESFLSWLIHTTQITWPELRVLYTVYGSPDITERDVPHLRGFADSRPVRVGNAAAEQLQLDVYGEVLDAVHQFVARGGRLNRATQRMLIRFGETVCRRWREPDEGIWEPRAGPRHNTHSKVMCWVALDRLLKLHDAKRLRAPAQRFAAERSAICREVEARGFSVELNSYVTVLDGTDVDASLLQFSRYGYVPASSPRMRGTVALVEQSLGRNGFICRYDMDDGLPPGEGAFGICSFWAANAHAMAGDLDRATLAFERMLDCANDVWLFSEQVDAKTREPLGNFPQAFTHVGLIDAALTLAGRTRTPAGPEQSPSPDGHSNADAGARGRVTGSVQ